MATKIARIVLLAAIFASNLSYAAEKNVFDASTIQALYENCKSDNDLRLIACTKYLSGVYELMQVIQVEVSDATLPKTTRFALAPFAICPTDTVTVLEMKQVFIAWAEKNPTEWQNPESMGAWSAFSEAWRCKAPS